MKREEAIKIVRNIYQTDAEKEALEALIPELKESEDERIRKMLIEKVEKWHEKALENNMVEDIKDSADIITYLEKQKEPHYTKRNALFDKCVENCDPTVMKKVSDEVDEMLEKEQKPISQEDFDTAKHEALWGEQKPIPANSVGLKEQKPEWSEEDEKQIAQIERIVKNAGCSKMLQEKIHNWLESLRPQPKVDWGGEDEKWFDYFERLLEFGYNKDPHHLGKLCIDGKMWLKSLRPQPHWKPSEEQMKALEDAFRKNGSDEYRKTINSLYQDLKKL